MRARWCAILTVVIVSSGVFRVSAQDHVSEPKFETGDYWHFRVQEDGLPSSTRALTGIYELLYNGASFVVAQGSGAKRTVLDREDGELNILYAMVGRGNYHGGQYLKFLLAVGHKWNFEYSARLRGLQQATRFSAQTEVVDFENIKTPAGAFRTFKIIRNTKAKNLSKFTYNYSAETKSIVKMFYDFRESSGGTRSVELLGFGSMCGATLACETK